MTVISVLPLNRNFGFFFALIFLLISGLTAVYGYKSYVVYFWFITSAVTYLIAVIYPSILTPFNKLWMQLGFLMGKVINPLVLGFIFFLLITPVALICRLIGRDELRLKTIDADSFWIDRLPSGPDGESLKNQF